MDKREKIILLLSPGMLRRGDALNGEGELLEDDTYLFLTKKYKGILADQILALFNEEEIRKQEYDKGYEQARANLDSPEVLSIAQEALKGAKREERERVMDTVTNELYKRRQMFSDWKGTSTTDIKQCILSDLTISSYELSQLRQALKEKE